MNPFDFWAILTIGTFVYSLPFDELVKMTMKDALDYTGLFPAIGGI